MLEYIGVGPRRKGDSVNVTKIGTSIVGGCCVDKRVQLVTDLRTNSCGRQPATHTADMLTHTNTSSSHLNHKRNLMSQAVFPRFHIPWVSAGGGGGLAHYVAGLVLSRVFGAKWQLHMRWALPNGYRPTDANDLSIDMCATPYDRKLDTRGGGGR